MIRRTRFSDVLVKNCVRRLGSKWLTNFLRMIQLFKQTLKRLLAAGNIMPVAMTPASEIRGLMQKLRPLETSIPLIRLGPNGDGGYLVPDDLAGIRACFSPGVSDISGFESDCADRGLQAFLADRSVDGPANAHSNFHFTKKFVGAVSNEDFMTLDEWVAVSVGQNSEDLMLQIDIEGFEYETFLCASPALLERFRIIVAEFHGLEQLWNKPYFDVVSRVFEKLLQGHGCVHIHPNNCCGSVSFVGLEIPSIMEMTFLRKDRISGPTFQTKFPHPLDFDNTENPKLVLPQCWY